MKYIKLFENFEDYDPYELMIIPPNKKGEMLMKEIKKDKPNLNLVSDLIVLGANVDWQDEYGRTALHYCGQYDHLEIIAKMLIDAGADVNIQHSRGWTPLHIFTFYNHSRIVRMLLDAGADKTISDNEGRLPYEFAKTQELKELLNEIH
jgi:ankyrin repeat protein